MENIYVNGIDITSLVSSLEFFDEMEQDKVIGCALSTQVKLKLKNKDNLLDQLMDYPFVIGNKSYYVYDKPEKWTKNISVTLYDKMIFTNIAYKTKLLYPTTVSNQLDEMSNLAGIAIDKNTLSENILLKPVNWYDNTIIIRNYIGFIAECDGKNAFIENDKIVFKPIAVQSLNTNFCSDFEINESITFTRVCFDNGLIIPLEKGDETGKTLYVSNNNPYIEQTDIDRIYDMYNGLSFTSCKKLKCRNVDDIKITDILNYHNVSTIVLSLKRKVYGGSAKDSLDISSNLTLKNVDTVIVKDNQDLRIKKIQTNIDQNNAKLEIIAEEVNENTQKVAELEISTEGIVSEIKEQKETLYLIETGQYNIFDKCHQFIQKENETDIKYSDNMPLAISKEYMNGKEVCISVSVDVVNGIVGSGYAGAEFTVTFEDDSTTKVAVFFYSGELLLQTILSTNYVSLNKRIYNYCKLPEDKKIKSVSNLKIIATMRGDKVYVSNPKVEFGNYPTGFEFDMPYFRDNIKILNTNYTAMNQKVNELSLKAVSMTEEIRTIQGNVTNITTRLESTELKLTPTAITAAVNEKIGEDGALTTVKFVLDKNGGHFKGGGIDISNNIGEKVLFADTEGNLTLKGTITSSTININKKFIVDSEGNMISNSGKIANWEITNEGFKTSSTWIVSNNYTEQDKQKVRGYILGETTLTEEEYDFLDINRDGLITSVDYVLIENIISGKISRTWKHTVTISPDDPSKFIKLETDRGNGSVSIDYVPIGGIDKFNIKNNDQRINKNIKDILDLMNRVNALEMK